jgi:hypothetical protein
MQLGRPIGAADADAVAEGIVPCAKSSSSMGTCIIDCIRLSFIILSSVGAEGMASACHSACQYVWQMLLLITTTYFSNHSSDI